MTNTDQTAIQESFAARCAELLDVMVDQADKEDTWDLYLAKGAGDRAIAGDHEERHLLELLQNARDAIYRGYGEKVQTPGRVFVAVTEHGMAMANTGAPFRLHDEDVLKAVRFLQRSDKASRGFIGHKGVGLKSILLRAGAFAVRSRIDGDLLRATFSRSRTAEYLLAQLDHNADAPSNGQVRYVRQQLPRFPLFTQPHADTANGDSLGEDTWLVEALLDKTNKRALGLDSTGERTAPSAYTTVVYLPYRDKRWETLLEQTKAALPSDDRAAFEQAKKQSGLTAGRANGEHLWQELMELDRRVLVLLGEITEFQFARFAGGALQALHRVDIEHALSALKGPQASRPRQIRIRERRWSARDGLEDVKNRSFVLLSKPTALGTVNEARPDHQEPHEHIRILLEIPGSDHLQLRDEPLFLYYPIETERSGLPFIIHGPFRVNASRTALVKSEHTHNRNVLNEAVQLLRRQLPVLLEASWEIRRWLPWMLLPLIDPETDDRSQKSALQQELVEMVIALLRDTPSVPTTVGLRHPDKVHFFPERPEALLLLDDHRPASPPDAESPLCLLASENLETYQRLRRENGDPFENAARRTGLGQVDLIAFTRALVAHFGSFNLRSSPSVNAEHARTFFLNLCALLEEAKPEVARETANRLGEHRIPLLPVLDTDGQGNEQLKMVQAEVRQRGESAQLQKASRVVFWEASGKQARFEIPKPPATVPVHFIASSVIAQKPALIEWALSKFGDTWLVAAFNGRPDLFRRVAERAGNLEDERVLPVLGYLAGLLHQITEASPTGAEDLQPHPYGAIDIHILHQELHVYRASSDRRRTAREQLQRLQQWEQIPVPVQGETSWAPASSAVFGPAWSDIIDDFLATLEDKQREQFARYERWSEAIQRLHAFRDAIGRSPDDRRYPEILPPSHPRWTKALETLAQVGEDAGTTPSTKILFDLLLLLGVRVGPRVAWRWINHSQRAEPFDRAYRAIDLATSEHIFQGQTIPEAVMPSALSQSNLMTAYRETLTLEPYHPAFSGGHSKGNRQSLRRSGKMVSHLAAWIWFPDLVESDIERLPFNGHLTSIDAFRELLLQLWPELSARVLKTGWYSQKWQHGRSWEKTIPSMAAFQLAQLKIWQARPVGHVKCVAQRRFPANAMIAWEREEAPSGRDQVRFFPLFDAEKEILATVAQDLEIMPLNKLTLRGALLRLNWLLQESRGEAEETVTVPAGCWPIQAPNHTNPNDWVGVQYYLLERIVHADPERLWDRRAVAVCGLTLRVALVDGHAEIAVPVVRGEDDKAHFATSVAFFQNPPRRWDKRAHKGRWVIQERSQLSRPLHRWARSLGAERLETVKPPAFTGESVRAPEAIQRLQQEVNTRLDLILGVLKANRVENLEEKAQQLLRAMDNLQAVRAQNTHRDGLSGLDAEDRLVFSYEAYRQEEHNQRSGAVVLAEGLALLLKQPTAVGDFQHALTAPPRQVRLALDFRGVDVDALLSEVTSLADKHLNHLRGRTELLIQALSAIKSRPMPRLTWQTKNLTTDKRMQVIQNLKEGKGALADQVLEMMGKLTPHLSKSHRVKLLQTMLSENRSSMKTARALLRTLREADWSIEERRTFIETDTLQIPFQLLEQEEHVNKMKSTAATVALIDQIHADELLGVEDLIPELSRRAHNLRSKISVRAVDTSLEFTQRLKDTLKLPVPFEPPDLLILEWEEATWLQLTEALREIGKETLSETHGELRSVLKRCLADTSLAPLQENRERALSERERRIQNLERRLEEKSLHFDLNLALSTNGPFSGTDTVIAETSSPGGSGGVSAGVTEDQAVRGRVAELFVLHTCWQRFLAQDPTTRAQLLDAIISRREQGSGEGEEHVRWSTKTALRVLKTRLHDHREALLHCSDDNAELARLFQDLIEVTNERGPGYDVLDPFGVWGTREEVEMPHPRRVEIKAILHDSEAASYRIVLSTNEFHRAAHDPASYVLRLITVPRDPEHHLAQVQWICDIPNPVERLRLGEQIRKGVRGGMLPLKLQIGT